MTSSQRFDVVILGAGPSGCVSTLRLLALGYTVAMVERANFPRPHVGESLSPGVRDILRFVNAEFVLDACPSLRKLPTRLIWESREPLLIAAGGRGPGTIVARAYLDAQLATLAESRGAKRYQPAMARRVEGKLGAFRIKLEGPGIDTTLEASAMIDARGRAAGAGRERILLGVPTHSLWSECDSRGMPSEMTVEALPNAWLWGSPVPNGRFRVIAFFDPADLRARSDPEKLFRSLISQSQLLGRLAEVPFGFSINSRATTAFLNTKSHPSGYFLVGERSLALDPLSSSGVETSMRSALTAVLAVNTSLVHPQDSAMAEAYHFERLVESAAEHAVWTSGYYDQAWPDSNHVFWRDRSTLFLDQQNDFSGVRERLANFMHNLSLRSNEAGTSQSALPTPGLNERVRLSREVGFAFTPCAIEDFVKISRSVTHRRLSRPVAFLSGIELASLLDQVNQAETIADLLFRWARISSPQVAIDILRWLVENEILVKSTPNVND